MTGFKPLFKQMFLQKVRYVHLVLLVQTFAVLFMTIISWLTNDEVNIFIFFYNPRDYNIWDFILGLGWITTIFADIVFAALLCWQNEKINLSQTWRLVPISSTKMWLINIFSSLIQCVYIFVIQLAIGFIVLLLDFLSSHENLAPEIKSFFGLSRGYSWADFWPFLEFLLYLVGICLIIFTFVSFANLLTRTITDQLPGKNTTGIKIVVMAILVIVAVVIAFRFNDQMTAMYIRHAMKNNNDGYVDIITVAIAEFFAGSVLLGIIDSYLMHKFVEPRIVNR